MTTYNIFNLDSVHPSWRPCLTEALDKVDPDYLTTLAQSDKWLPGPHNIFNAFSLPVEKVNYVLFGESPYPRAQSANGYAFWDAAVGELWAPTGLSKQVNRATSLRNIIKMLLIAEGLLQPNQTGQEDIAKINKDSLLHTNSEFFTSFINHGFLLLNATLVLQPNNVRKDALAWHPFVKHVLDFLFAKHPHVKLILFGNIANTIDKLINHHQVDKLYAEHPYNISFINNPEVIKFFGPLRLLNKTK
ncbi:MAG: uracil-DNA glycosylase family protein [Gammaproteobacteria bacterium]